MGFWEVQHGHAEWSQKYLDDWLALALFDGFQQIEQPVYSPHLRGQRNPGDEESEIPNYFTDLSAALRLAELIREDWSLCLSVEVDEYHAQVRRRGTDIGWVHIDSNPAEAVAYAVLSVKRYLAEERAKGSSP